MTPDSRRALSFFLPDVEIRDLTPLGEGNVNDTWLVVSAVGSRYVLQRLNTAVFPDPGLVQDNLAILTDHLEKELRHVSEDFTILRLLPGPGGGRSYVARDGSWWRLLSHIDNSRSVNTVATAEQARQIGHALGLFHRLTAPLPLSSLADPLPGFHITPLYLEQYDQLSPSAGACETDCRDFIEKRRQDVSLLEDARRQNVVSQRIVHGDPKVANFLFSRDLNRVLSLIDLDTVKPGLLLHDIGDCLRSCCNRSGEEVQDPADVTFDQKLFASMLDGYCQYGSGLLARGDRELIVDSVRLISFELGLRFYSDHLAGNRYFKVDAPGQNLFRARVQFALVRSMESQYTALKRICDCLMNS